MTEQQSAKTPPRSRTLLRRGLLALVATVAVIAFGAYYVLFMRNHVTTDDAYVNGNLVLLTPQIGGTVIAINTDETQYVRRGQVLVRLDPRDAQIALAQAKANLAETVREVAQLFDEERRDAALVAAAQTQLTQSGEDLTRDRSLLSVHGVSLENLEHDENAVSSARAALQQAQATLASTQAAIAGTTPATQPRVLQAEANLRAAWLELSRTRVLAPISGYVVRRAVELGEQVTPSTQMLALVPERSMWVDANFKENQLGELRIGQSVRVSVDMYGSRVEYHGKVLGLTAGTGSALAVLPTQNASGNWIKIVQRLPVRIGLEPAELVRHPLFLGLSANIDVSVKDRAGSALSRIPAWPASQRTDVYTDQASGADRIIDDVVAANLHRSGQALYARASTERSLR
ncbi:MAG: HlyD family efflux transporter periplasmic adaptor subunit [Steroidobacteraceae bacterium]